MKSVSAIPIRKNYKTIEEWAEALSSYLENNKIDMESAARAQPPIGTQVKYPSNTMPGGWLDCDGASYARTRYPQLSFVIGGSGATFAVPNVAGEMIRAE